MNLIAVLPNASSPAVHEIQESLGMDTVDPNVSILSTCLYRGTHTKPASSYIIKSRETGSRTIVNYNELPEMTCDEFVQIVESRICTDQLDEDIWFHFEVRSAD